MVEQICKSIKGGLLVSDKSNYLHIPITMPVDVVLSLEELNLKAKISAGKK